MRRSLQKYVPSLRVAAAVFAAGFAISHASGADSSDAPAPKAKEPAGRNHYLFMGANLLMRYQGAPRPVLAVEGENYSLAVGGKSTKVPLPHSSDLVLQRSFKLADQAVRIEGLKTAQGYTSTDRGDLKRGGLAMETVSGEAGMQYLSEVNMMESTGALSLGQTEGSGNSLVIFEPGSYTVTSAQAGLVYSSAESSLASSIGLAMPIQNEARPPVMLFPEKPDSFSVDALKVEFEVSSATPIAKPYVVVLVKYALRDKPAEELTTFYVKGFPVFGPKPVSVKMPQNGFPKGFVFKEAQVHVYGQGRELASNVAEKQMALSEADAHAYLVIQYVVGHRKETLAPRPLFKKYPVSLRDRLREERFNRVLYVKVSEAGLPEGVYSDEGCTQKAEGELDSLVSSWRFLPAVADGKAVEGVAKVRPSDTSI